VRKNKEHNSKRYHKKIKNKIIEKVKNIMKKIKNEINQKERERYAMKKNLVSVQSPVLSPEHSVE
jgi:hypothetical protein